MAGKRETQARIRVTRLKHHLQGTTHRDDARGREEEERVLEKNASPIVVVGGSVMDVHLSCDSHFIEGSTVPGRVVFRHGGVGRNIAECLGRLRQRPLFISAVGSDGAGREILQELQSRGVSTRGVKVCRGSTTSMVACTFDATGNLTNGVADTSLVERELDCQWVEKFRKEIEGCKLLVLEANLHAQTLKACVDIAHKSRVPVFYEPVSVTKSVRVLPVLSKVTYLSPNEAELSEIAAAIEKAEAWRKRHTTSNSNSSSSSSSSSSSRESKSKGFDGFGGLLPTDEVARQAQLVRSLGAKNVLVTRGREGVYAATEDGKAQVLPSLEVAKIANVNGAGDCLVAGILKALAGNDSSSSSSSSFSSERHSNARTSLEYAVSYGIAVACAAIQSPLNVPEIGDNLDEIDANALHVFSNRITMGAK